MSNVFRDPCQVGYASNKNLGEFRKPHGGRCTLREACDTTEHTANYHDPHSSPLGSSRPQITSSSKIKQAEVWVCPISRKNTTIYLKVFIYRGSPEHKVRGLSAYLKEEIKCSGKVAQWIKYVLCKLENLSSNLQCPCKSWWRWG